MEINVAVKDSKQELFEYQNTKQKLTWEIDNFKDLYDHTENSKWIQSQKHAVYSNADPKDLLFEWFFKLYPKGQNQSYENALSVFLHIESLKVPCVHAEVICSFKDESENIIATEEHTKKFVKKLGSGYYEFLPRDYINKYAIRRKLSFEADLTFSYYHKTLPLTKESDSDCKDHLVIFFPKNRMSQDISVYLNKDALADITISAGDQKFFGHKFILSARSSVFAAMFGHDFKENNDNLVTVEESPTVFYQILEYIYSDKFPTEDTVSEELYAAAHKYDLEELQDVSQALLGNSISMENVLNRLQCADLHNIAQLKKKAMNFIKKNSKVIVKSDKWKKIMTDNVDLASEILEFVLS